MSRYFASGVSAPSVTQIGTKLTGAGATSAAITLGAAVATGKIVVVYAVSAGSTAASSATAADTAGNTWTRTNTRGNANGIAFVLFYGPVTSAISNGDTLTISSLPSETWRAWAYVVDNNSAYNTSVSSSDSSGTSHSTGSTSGSVSASGTDAAIYLYGSYNSSITDSSGGTLLSTATMNSNRYFSVFWDVCSAGTQSRAFTTAGSTATVAGLMVTKA